MPDDLPVVILFSLVAGSLLIFLISMLVERSDKRLKERKFEMSEELKLIYKVYLKTNNKDLEKAMLLIIEDDFFRDYHIELDYLLELKNIEDFPFDMQIEQIYVVKEK